MIELKIMYLLFSFTVGGTERLVSDICNEMVEKEHEVYLYIVNDLYSEEVLNTLDKKVNVVLQKRKVGSGSIIKTILELTKFIRYNNIEVVHCNSFAAPELLILKEFCFRKTKIIHTIHDVGQYVHLKKWRVKLRNYLCDYFVAISESVKVDIIKFGAKKDKIRIIHNAINLERFTNYLRKEIDLNYVILGNVARFMPEKKGQDILIDAVEMLKEKYPHIKCVFAGGCDEAHRAIYDEMQQDIINRGLNKNIVFWGNVDDVKSFLQTIDIFVLPSRYEGFGISLIEAMAMGIPCIASDLDGPAEIIGNNERGILFKTNSANDLALKIEGYLCNNLKINQYKNLVYVHEKFDIKNMCIELLKLYT